LAIITNKLTSRSIFAAIRAYEKGDRPFRFTEPRSWYVAGSSRKLYPLKYIYAMAVGSTPSSFNTSEPLREFPLVGFSVYRQPKDEIADFEAKVRAAMRDTRAARAARLAQATTKPKSLRVQHTIAFERNPDVVAEVLSQARGLCAICKSKAPFLRKKDRTPYLEVHHKVQLAHGGDDTVENAIAVCPNCHRQAHHG
jgi:5-methylcytosine-specific restriction enzyme A